MWAKPRKVNEVPFVSGWLVPPGRLLRKSTKRVLSGWSDSPYRAKRLPKTPRTRLASRKSSNAITASSAKRTRVHPPLRRGRTSVSNHSSSTWCRKMFERQGEITPSLGSLRSCGAEGHPPRLLLSATYQSSVGSHHP